MTTKAMIYVPECNVDVFKTDADNYVFDAEGDALNDNDWIGNIESNGIEVSVYSEILEEI